MQLEAPATILFSLFYFLFSMGFVFQFREFSAIGLSPENLLTRVLPFEEIDFLRHHVIRSAGTLQIHAWIPAVYVAGFSYFTTHVDGNHASIGAFLEHWPSVQGLLAASVVLGLSVHALASYWKAGDYAAHPFIRKFRPYLTATRPGWAQVASDINVEFR